MMELKKISTYELFREIAERLLKERKPLENVSKRLLLTVSRAALEELAKRGGDNG